MAEKASYRNTRTGAIRKSSTPMGYPFEKMTQAEVREAAKETKPADDGEAKGGDTK